MGGKSKGGPVGPTPQEEFNTAKSYWEDYSKWTQQEAASRDKDLAQYRAQYAAGGGVGSEMYNKLAAEREAKYNEAMAGLEKGERGRSLKGYEKDFRQALKSQYSLGSYQMQDPMGDNPRMAWQGQDQGKFGRYVGKLGKEDQALVDRGNQLTKDIYRLETTSQDDYGMFGRRNNSQLGEMRKELKGIKSQLSTKQAEIDKMSMEQLYESMWGKANIGAGDKETAAMERAKGFGGGRAPKGSGAGAQAQPSAFFASEDGTGWW